MLRLSLAVVASYLMAGAVVAADAMSTLNVEGWKQPGGGKIMVYTADGIPVGPQDLSKLPISGRHSWNKDYDVVQVGTDKQWVPRAALNFAHCGDKTPNDPQWDSIATAPRTTYGSGNPCK